jgi:hypothetical protein
MYSAIRVTFVVGLIGYFGLVLEMIYSFDQDPRTRLSNWHPSDNVPCLMWLNTVDLNTGIEGCECITVLERPNITEASDTRQSVTDRFDS